MNRSSIHYRNQRQKTIKDMVNRVGDKAIGVTWDKVSNAAIAVVFEILDKYTEKDSDDRSELKQRLNELIVFGRYIENKDHKYMMAKAGRLGGSSKNSDARALKTWAEQQAKTMKGADRAIARKLAAKIPEHLAGASENPDRLIYDHLRTLRNTAS